MRDRTGQAACCTEPTLFSLTSMTLAVSRAPFFEKRLLLLPFAPPPSSPPVSPLVSSRSPAAAAGVTSPSSLPPANSSVGTPLTRLFGSCCCWANDSGPAPLPSTPASSSLCARLEASICARLAMWSSRSASSNASRSSGSKVPSAMSDLTSPTPTLTSSDSSRGVVQ